MKRERGNNTRVEPVPSCQELSLTKSESRHENLSRSEKIQRNMSGLWAVLHVFCGTFTVASAPAVAGSVVMG